MTPSETQVDFKSSITMVATVVLRLDPHEYIKVRFARSSPSQQP